MNTLSNCIKVILSLSVASGWKNTNAFFKFEKLKLILGSGKAKALDIFNQNTVSYRKI